MLSTSYQIVQLIKSRRLRLTAHVEEKRSAYRIGWRNRMGRGHLERPRQHRLEDDKLDLTETGWEDMDCTDLAEESKN